MLASQQAIAQAQATVAAIQAAREEERRRTAAVEKARDEVKNWPLLRLLMRLALALSMVGGDMAPPDLSWPLAALAGPAAGAGQLWPGRVGVRRWMLTGIGRYRQRYAIHGILSAVPFFADVPLYAGFCLE